MTLPQKQNKPNMMRHCNTFLKYKLPNIEVFTDMLKRKRYFGRKDSVRKNIYFENYMQTVSLGKLVCKQSFTRNS